MEGGHPTPSTPPVTGQHIYINANNIAIGGRHTHYDIEKIMNVHKILNLMHCATYMSIRVSIITDRNLPITEVTPNFKKQNHFSSDPKATISGHHFLQDSFIAVSKILEAPLRINFIQTVAMR